MTQTETQPFDDIRALFEALPPVSQAPAPAGAGQALPALAAWLRPWRGAAPIRRPVLCLYAGAHAGGDIGPMRERMEALAAGGAALNHGLAHLGAGLDVFDLALERPVADVAVGAAMSERDCAATMAFGMEALAKQPDLLVLRGEGPGADQAGADLGEALSGAEGRARPAVLRARAEAGGDPLQLLRQLGGRETAALAGAILAARQQGVPVLLDGVAALAAAAVVQAVDAGATVHCRISATPQTPPGLALAARLELSPLLGAPWAAEDGTAAVAALSLIRLAAMMAAGG